MRRATASVFSGRFISLGVPSNDDDDAEYVDVLGENGVPTVALLLYVGEMGVGGGACVPGFLLSSREDLVSRLGLVTSVSVSEPDEDRSSSSQLSATGAFLTLDGLGFKPVPVFRESRVTDEASSDEELVPVIVAMGAHG
jgi:hypothetical protein